MGRYEFGRGNRDDITLPDSPAPSRSILISFLAIIRSFLSWLSISSFPAIARANIRMDVCRKKSREGLTGFGLGIDASRRLYATHFDEWLQRMKVIKQEVKERAASPRE